MCTSFVWSSWEPITSPDESPPENVWSQGADTQFYLGPQYAVLIQMIIMSLGVLAVPLTVMVEFRTFLNFITQLSKVRRTLDITYIVFIITASLHPYSIDITSHLYN